MNWIPWAPIAAVGLFLLFVGIIGLLEWPSRENDDAPRPKTFIHGFQP